ncbi:hypothetical protein CVT24_007954, partial [Panaeolus cyanescens]
TSATVYGLFSWSNISSLVIQYELDGNVTTQSYLIDHATPLYHEKAPVYINTPFFSYESLSPSTHSLKVTVKEIFNTSFRFDYITYAPSFSTLSSRTNPNPNPVSSATVASLDQGDNYMELKVIIGSVIGGLALLALALACLVCWNRRLNARARIGVSKVDKAANDAPHTQEQPRIQDAHKLVHISTAPLPSQFTSPPASTSPLTVSPYPPEKISDYRSSSPGTAFPVLEHAPATTVSPYPSEKVPDISTMPRENPRATNHAIAKASHSEDLEPGSANEVSQPADSSDVVPSNTGCDYLSSSTTPAGLVMFNETSSRPPSYTRSY